MTRPDQRPLCLSCGGLVAPHDGTNGETGDCPACGPVHFTGTPGDIDLTRPSLPRYVPDEAPPACFTCGAALSLDCLDGAAPGVDATCPHCGPVAYVVFHDDRGQPLQGYMALREQPPQRDDGEALAF